MKKTIAGLCIIPLAVLAVYAQNDFGLNSVSASDVVGLSESVNIQPEQDLDLKEIKGAPEDNGFYPKSAGDAYRFPIIPGMEEWKDLASYAEMLKVCQIPEPLLRKMSTAGLIETVLNYPLYMLTLLSYDSMQQGFDIMTERFNGLKELLERKDAGAELLAKYRGMDPAGFKADFTGGIGKYHFNFYSVEIMLAQDAVRNRLTETQRQELQKELLAKYQAKKRIGGYGGSLAKEVMSLNGVSSQEDSLRVSPTVVYTTKGAAVQALQMEPGDELEDARQCDIDFIVGFPDATWEAGCTRMYNCHSYAWHNQSVLNAIWIDTPYQKEYWLDGSYIQWLGPVTSGMKLDYSADNHSAIFVSGSNPFTSPDKSMCRAKWGQGPRMLSTCKYAPYNSTAIRAYTLTEPENEQP